MTPKLELRDAPPGAITIAIAGGRALWTYCFAPEAPANESPRPFVHPLYSIDGDVLTNWRPHDHPWHHALSFTLTSVNGVNFWGGPSYRAEDGYRWRDDHGEQRHVGWSERSGARLVEELVWCDPHRDGRVLIEEVRTLATELVDDGWTLRWSSSLRNATAETLTCHNYHSLGGLEGSHYTGLQFRGARGLLDQHGDHTIGLLGEAGARDLAALHGRPARWIEWHAQHDGSLRRTRLRFESLSGEVAWFVRPHDPLVACPPHRAEPWLIPPDATRECGQLLQFYRA